MPSMMFVRFLVLHNVFVTMQVNMLVGVLICDSTRNIIYQTDCVHAISKTLPSCRSLSLLIVPCRLYGSLDPVRLLEDMSLIDSFSEYMQCINLHTLFI